MKILTGNSVRIFFYNIINIFEIFVIYNYKIHTIDYGQYEKR